MAFLLVPAALHSLKPVFNSKVVVYLLLPFVVNHRGCPQF